MTDILDVHPWHGMVGMVKVTYFRMSTLNGMVKSGTFSNVHSWLVVWGKWYVSKGTVLAEWWKCYRT